MRRESAIVRTLKAVTGEPPASHAQEIALAQALCREHCGNDSWHEVYTYKTDHYRSLARTAINALSSQPVADGWLPIETAKRAQALAVSLRQCSIFVVADVGKHIAKSMTDAAEFLEALPASPGASE